MYLGSKGGTVVRALTCHQCGPGSNPGVDAICGLSLLLVLSLAPRGFSPGTPVLLSSQKPTFPNSNSNRNQVHEEPPCGCATCKSLFIYLFIYFYIFYVWVCCWFSPLLQEVFLQVLRFSCLLKNQHFQIPIQTGIRYTKNHHVDVLPANRYLFIYFYIFYVFSRNLWCCFS